MSEAPRLVVVIGANGAGKSTWCEQYPQVLPEPFFNADSIAQGLGDWNDPADQRRARELVDQYIEECLAERRSFGLETTYSGRSRPALIRRARDLGFDLHLVFVGTSN